MAADDEAVDGQAEEVVLPPDGEREGSDADDFKPGADLMTVDESEPQDVFRVMDLADEEQILDELQGRALEVMVYSFTPRNGKRQTGLSYWGVAEAVRTLNVRSASRIGIARGSLERGEVELNGDRFLTCTVFAEDQNAGGGLYGTAEQPVKMHLRSGDTKDDLFAFRKVLSKAQRNALKGLVPATYQQAIIAQFLGDESKVRRLRSHGLEPKRVELPAALATPEAIAFQEELRTLYRRLTAVSRTRMVPAEFNSYLVQTQHDMGRMGDFRGHLESLLVEEAEKAAAGEAERLAKLSEEGSG